MENQPEIDIIYPEECEQFIKCLQPFSVIDIGSEKWIDSHSMCIKMMQQAIIEARSYREETIKEFFIIHSKLKVLVHEAFSILIWRTKILPKLLEFETNPPPATFLFYMVLYHEGTVISLLETILYHSNGCEMLEDSAIDLIDYCAQGIVQLINLEQDYKDIMDGPRNIEEDTFTELERQKKDLMYKIGIRCLSILSYLADGLDKISISAARRLITVNDIPCLLCEILQLKPWLRRTKKGFEKFIDEKWILTEGDNILKVTNSEAQTWFCLRQLLLHPTIMQTYKMTEYRRNQLMKCNGLLNDIILDQLPPLIELKQFLCSITMSGDYYANFQQQQQQQQKKNDNLIFEEIPEIKEKLLKEIEDYGGFMKIIEYQAKIFLIFEQEKLLPIANRLSSLYSLNIVEGTELNVEKKENNNSGGNISSSSSSSSSSSTTTTSNNNNIDYNQMKNKCGNCEKEAMKKCSICKCIYYCSRECQVADWPSHKQVCPQLLKD